MHVNTQVSTFASDTTSVPALTGADPVEAGSAAQLELPLEDQQPPLAAEELKLKDARFAIIVSSGASRLAVEHAQKRMTERGGHVTLRAAPSELRERGALFFDDDIPMLEVLPLPNDDVAEFALVLIGQGMSEQAQSEIKEWLDVDGHSPQLIALGPASAEQLAITIDHARTRDASVMEEFIEACERSMESAH